MKGSVKEPNKFHVYETEKITLKAHEAAEYIELFSSFTRDHHARSINVILWTSTDICVVVRDDLGWKNQTTLYIMSRHWLYKWFCVRRKRPQIYASVITISGERTEQHIVIGFGELAVVD